MKDGEILMNNARDRDVAEPDLARYGRVEKVDG